MTNTKVTKAERYEHVSVHEPSNETVAILADGRRLNVCLQYHAVMPLATHADNCSQVTKMGGRCDCGLLADIDVEAILADARQHGLFGPAPKSPVADVIRQPATGKQPCPHCGSYCEGDCQAH